MAFLETLKGLSLQKKLLAAGAIVLTVVAMTALVRTASRPPMALLYAGLDDQTAAEILTRLDSEGVAYELDGQRIFVPAPARDRLRLDLAQDGLPRQSVTGYELLDDLSGFSTTSDMFSAAYWRAKEGELTRTILTLPAIRAARVHIAVDDRSPFARQHAPRSASVTVTAPSGLSAQQIRAIQHMTALAVSQLSPDNVAVIDTDRGLLTANGEEAMMGAALDEDGRARNLERELTNLLEARVGPGNVRVSVAMQLTREREAFTENTVDPDTAVVTTRKRTESRENERGSESAVTVASDLPDGDANTAGEQSLERTETKEEVAYAMSRRDRTVERLPGEIERLTVAVLLNHVPAEDGEGTVARPADEIAAFETLVETAAGLVPERGDRLTVQSMPFEKPVIEPLEGTGAIGTLTSVEPRLWQVGQLAFLGLVTLILGLFVVKPILTSGGSSPAIAELEAGGRLIEDPITMLRSASADAPEAAAALLNAWLEEEDAA
jgi:flagellar M-ring protein FliF